MENKPLAADMTASRSVGAIAKTSFESGLRRAEVATPGLDPDVRRAEYCMAIRRSLAMHGDSASVYRPADITEMDTSHLRSLVLMGIAELEARGDRQTYSNGPAMESRAKREPTARDEFERFAIGTGVGEAIKP